MLLFIFSGEAPVLLVCSLFAPYLLPGSSLTFLGCLGAPCCHFGSSLFCPQGAALLLVSSFREHQSKRCSQGALWELPNSLLPGNSLTFLGCLGAPCCHFGSSLFCSQGAALLLVSSFREHQSKHCSQGALWELLNSLNTGAHQGSVAVIS